MKKSVRILISLLSLMLVFGFTISAADLLPGDVNGDGHVNSSDAIYLLRHSVMPDVYLINQSGDMNGDGKTNGSDAIYLLRHTIFPDQYPLKEGPVCEHSEVIDPAVEPTCTTPGLTEGKHCERCQAVIVRQERIDPIPHTFEKAVCTVCGAKAAASGGLSYTRNADGTSYSVTGIGSCKDTCIVIPSEYRGLPVKAIGEGAFAKRYGLKEIILPDGLTEIGTDAFSEAIDMEYIFIPDSVTAIGEGAFRDCHSLQEIQLPKGISELSDDLFENCFGFLSFSIPEHITKIGKRTFAHCWELKTVTFHGGVTEIGEGAFEYCLTLQNVVLPERLHTLSASAFRNCSALESVEFPEDLTQFGEEAFSGCTSLTTIVFPKRIQSIPKSAFADCTALTAVQLPENLKTIENYAFKGSGLTEIIIPESVSSIGQSVFYGCRSLKSVTLPSSLTQIALYTFKNCSALETIVIPGGVQFIRTEAFSGCTSLQSVELPVSLEMLETFSFAGCSALETIVFTGSEGEWILLPKQLLWDEGAGDYTLTCLKQSEATDNLQYQLSSDGLYYIVTGIGDTQIADIVIPSSYNDIPVLSICDSAFSNCDHLITVTIEDGLRSIGDRAFFDCNRLVSVDMPDSVTEIGEQVFDHCYELRSVSLPTSLTELPAGLFRNCRQLEGVALPSTLKYIGDEAFSGCYALEIVLPYGLNVIGEQAFAYCGFEQITIPDTVEIIGVGAFSYCNFLGEIVLPDALFELGARAFFNCVFLSSVEFSENLTVIGEGAFGGCVNLSHTSITIPASVACIESAVFQYINGLSISYDGTQYAWMAIEKAEDWDQDLSYTLTFMEADDTLKDIYDPRSYSGSYAFRYLGTLPKGEALQKYYGLMDTLCYQFHIGNVDIQPMQSAGGEYGVLGILDFSAHGLTADEANGVWVAYILDHPLYYWIDNSLLLSDTSLYVLVSPEYFLASERAMWNQKIYGKLYEWTALVREETSPYQIALAYHDRIVSEIDYAFEADGYTPQDDVWAHNIVGVLGGLGEGVCESYAKTFHLLLNYSDVENVYVNGYTDGGHAWNMVRLDDGNWYWCDLTWDDNPSWAWGIDYHYFCINSTQNVNWYYQDGGYLIDNNGDGILDHEAFTDTHTPDPICSEGMRFAYPLPEISETVYDGTLRDTFVVNDMVYAISGYRTVQFVYSEKNGNVSIPETVHYDGVLYTVTSIGGILDNGIYFPLPTLYSANAVYIPKTVNYIWDGAFDGNDIIVTVDAENLYYYSENGRVYPKTMIGFGWKQSCRPEKIRKRIR